MFSPGGRGGLLLEILDEDVGPASQNPYRTVMTKICERLPERLIGTLRKTRWQRQRERHQTKGLMSKTMAVLLHYNSWYISLPSSVKQQREMTNFCVVWRT